MDKVIIRRAQDNDDGGDDIHPNTDIFNNLGKFLMENDIAIKPKKVGLSADWIYDTYDLGNNLFLFEDEDEPGKYELIERTTDDDEKNHDKVVLTIESNESMDKLVDFLWSKKASMDRVIIRKAIDMSATEPQGLGDKVIVGPKLQGRRPKTRHDYLSADDLARDQQKTPRWDRQQMPENSGDGYNMSNRFQDSDKAIDGPLA